MTTFLIDFPDGGDIRRPVRHVADYVGDHEYRALCGAAMTDATAQPFGHPADIAVQLMSDDPDMCQECRKKYVDDYMDFLSVE